MIDERDRSLVGEALAELWRARKKFPAFHSPHEGYAVIAEEFDELWLEVKRYPNVDRAKMRAEAIQVAAMALRFVEDLCQ